MSSNLAKRLIVAAAGIPAIIFIIYEGGLYLYALCLLVAILGGWELAAMLLSRRIVIKKRLVTLAAIVVVSAFQFRLLGEHGLLMIAALFTVIALWKIAETGSADFISKISVALFAAIYPGFLIAFAILIRRDLADFGWVILLFVFVNTWLADTFAYAFGRWFGKRKLAPNISPKKTVVGFVSSFAGGLLAAVMAYYYLEGRVDMTVLMVASMAATLFGQIGDLVESAVKRDCSVKDSSNLIPGHGGVLDRFDSLFFALPAAYFTLLHST